MYTPDADLFPSVSYMVRLCLRLLPIFWLQFIQGLLNLFIGDSFNSCLVAVAAVDPDVLRDWAASERIKVGLFTLRLVMD